jgi:hypothetical protein
MGIHQPFPTSIDYNPSKHGKLIGIQFGCFVFQDTMGKWYCFRHPREMHRGAQWTFYLHPGFQIDTPSGMSPASWHAWVDHQREALRGKPLSKYHHEENGHDIEEEWTEVNSVVFAKMFRVERPSETELCYLQQKLEQFARMYPERVVKQEEEREEKLCALGQLKIE